MVVRHDVNVEAIGKMAQLPPDLSPLQIGTRGLFEKRDFTILGRIRVVYDEGSWNEWYACFGDNNFGWVAEAQGFFMVSFEYAPAADFPKGAAMASGASVKIAGEPFLVMDRRETTILGAEGELPFSAPAGRTATSVDLMGANHRFACAEFSSEGTRLFVGNYARFDDLQFTNLRKVPGWDDEAMEPAHHETSTLQCPKCGGAVALRAAGFTMSAACDSCGSFIDTATPELKLIRRAHGQQRIQPVLPLGRRGVLFGVNYEVIGFQCVKDEYVSWTEYLLFNPWQGFAWLVTYNGHWSFVRRLLDTPTVSEGIFHRSVAHAKFKGDSYRIFATGTVQTNYVAGEFYWKIGVGMPAHVTDFVHPPHILSREAYPQSGEQTWSHGEYVDHELVEQAFGLEQPLNDPVGIYLNQPNPHAEKARQLKWITPLLVAILVAIQLISVNRAARQQVLDFTYNYQAGVTNPAAVTPPFEITGGNQTLEIRLHAPVDNNWLEVGLDLVNAETQQAVASLEQGIEYYHGYEGGESWSEGRQTRRRLIPAVKPGKYYFTVEASGDPMITQMPFTLTVVRDVVGWSNFFIAFALVLIYPIYCGWRASMFERQRWMDSDYSPYGSSSDDD